MRHRFFVSLFTIFFLFKIDIANAQKMRVELFVEPESLRIGDLLKITLELRFSEDTQFQLPDLRLNLLPIEVGNESITREKGKRDITIERHTFESFVFDTGRVVIPSQQIVYWHSSDTLTLNQTYTDSIWLYVKSVLSAGAQEIRDIKEPDELPQPFENWGIVLMLAALLIILGIVYYLWRKKENKPIIPFRKPMEIRPAHEIALESLQRLKSKNFIEKNEVNPYYMGLSRILREYIENRYFLKALEMTTTEMIDTLEKERLSGTIGDTVQEVLTNSDLVKFAQYIPEDSVAEILIEKTIQMVEGTKIVQEATEPTEQLISNMSEEKKD